ncbi:hypothetical protein DLREEDagrD3_12260 [Denitratisoma sp. agr-D3]
MTEGPVVSVQQGGEIRDEIQKVAPERALEWFKAGWRMFRAVPGIWVLIALALLLLNILIGILPPLLGGAAAAILMPLVGGGLMAACAAQDRGEALRFDYVHLGFRENTGPLATLGGLLLLGFLSSSAIALLLGGVGALLGSLGSTGLGAVLALGSLLLAGFAMLAMLMALTMAAWFAPALVMLSGRSPKDALRASFVACVKNWLPLLLYGILLWLLLALSLLTAGLGLLVLLPVVAGSVYQSFREIFD